MNWWRRLIGGPPAAEAQPVKAAPLVSRYDADWRPYVSYNKKRDDIRNFVDGIRPLEKDDPDLAIERYREAGRRIVALADEAPIQTPDDVQRNKNGDQWAIKRLAMLLRRHKRYAELVQEIEAFHRRFPASAINENDLKRWHREASVKLGIESPSAGYQQTLDQARGIAEDVAMRQANPQSYPVPLVGEQHRQAAIASCGVGEAVQLLHEPDNPYDSDAIVAICHGDRIGYVPRDSWVKRAVFKDRKALRAQIKSLNRGERSLVGVVIEVSVTTGPIATVEYAPE